MAKKKTLEDIIIESWEGTRHSHRLFKNRPDDFFIGYAVGVTCMQNLHLNFSIIEIEKKIRELLANNKL